MTGIAELIDLLVQVMPIVADLLHLFVKTPAEQRAQLVTTLHDAFQFAKDNGGDTSKIEAVIKGGK